MQKDVIYIDVEDDITAIIGKVKSADHKIVAMVPPKRIGVLQSAVNLRLIHRAAETSGKRLVLITNNSALTGLAAAASIPVAKNLQSKPSLAEIPALEVDDDDVIDGAQLPVGEHAKTAEKPTKEDPVDKTVEEIAAKEIALGTAAVGAATSKKKIAKARSPIKVPNFADTRKRLALIVASLVLLVGFLVWALVFAPSAKVIISARTTTSGVASKVSLSDEVKTDAAAKTIKSVTKEIKKDISVPINPTGKKDLGSKASGTVTFTHCSSDDNITIPQGTAVSANGLNFMTANAVVVEPSNERRGSCQNDYPASVTVIAQNNGDQYNLGPQSYQTAGQDGVSARASQMSGGTSKVVTVATAGDIQDAVTKVAEQTNPETAKGTLKTQLGGAIIIDQTFSADTSSIKPNVAADTEIGDTKPAVTGTAVYTMMAVEKKELSSYLSDHFKKEIDGSANQRVYDNGADEAKFVNITLGQDGTSATLSGNGKIGPKIDDNEVRQYARGKEYGEIQSHLEAISGVDSVDVEFSPFWVNSAPNDTKKIKVEFKLNEQ